MTARLPPAALPIAAALLALWTSLGAVSTVAPSDVAYYVDAAQQMMHGAVPYVDLVDINPPLVFYLNVPPVMFAHAIHASLIDGFLYFLCLAVLAQGVLLARVLAGISWLGRWRAASIVAMYFLATALYATSQFDVLGQREHLFALALAPWLFCRLARLDPASRVSTVDAVLAGALCGVTACLKPHFVAIVVATEAYAWLRFRPRGAPAAPFLQVEHGLFALALFAYGAHFAFLPSAMLEGFLRVASLVAERYGAYAQDLGTMLERHWIPYAVTLLVFAPVALAPARPTAAGRAGQCLAFVAVASLASFHLQHKGWAYHLAPLYLAWLLAVPLWWAAAPRWRAPALALIPAAAAWASETQRFAELVAAPDVQAAGAEQHPHQATVFRIFQLIKEWTVADEAVVVFSADPTFSYPTITQLGRRSGTRYYFLFPLAFFHPREGGGVPRYPAPSQLSAEEQRFVDDLVDDVNRTRPTALVFVRRQVDEYEFLPSGFDPLEYARSTSLLERTWFRERYRLEYADPTFSFYLRR